MRKPFEKIKLSQLHTLCNTLADAEVRDVSNIKRKYLESALSFDETLLVFKRLENMRASGDELILSKTFSLLLILLKSLRNFLFQFFFIQR